MEKVFIILFCLLIAIPQAFSQSMDDKKEVLKVVQTLFDAMNEADSAKAASVFLADGHSFRVQGLTDKNVNVSQSPHQSFISRVGSWKSGSILERMWDATVMIEDRIAMVWTPYDLYVNGNFSHCGIDLFSMIKTEKGWKIADITYTVKQQGCEESPLGPLKQ